MNGQSDKNGWYFAYGIYSVAGVQLAAAVIAGLFFGNYIDKKAGTSPWLAITGLVLGFVGGLYNLIRIMNWHKDRNKK